MTPILHVLGGGAGVIADPSVAWMEADAITGSATTTYDVTLSPSRQAGQVAIIILRVSSADDVTTPAGWTLLASDGASHAFGRLLDGSEGGTVTITNLTLARRASWIVYGVADAATGEASFMAANAVTGLDPAALAPSGWPSDKNHLWITFASERRTDNTFTAPTGYGSQARSATAVNDTSTAHCVIEAAHRSLATGSENPSAWGFTGTASLPRSGVIGLRAA